MKAWLQPKSFERRYQRFLKKTTEQVRKEFLIRLGYIFKLKNYSKFEPGPDDYILEDETSLSKSSDEINLAVAGLMAWWILQRSDIRATIRGYYHGINLYNDNQFVAVVKSVSGLSIPSTLSAPYSGRLVSPLPDLLTRLGENADVYRQEPYLEGIEKNWVSTQETYLDKTIVQAIGDSELIVRNGVVTALAANAIAELIDRKFFIVGKRVNAFGEDQVFGLDTQLSEKRQRSLGANEYIWQTRRDLRVRGNPNGLYPDANPSHFIREGKIFNWNNPPSDGHPGEPAGCRCRAIFRLPR